MRNSAVVYRNFMKAVKKLPDNMQGEAYEAYLLYALDGAEYTGDNYTVAALLENYREQIDTDREKHAAKCERAKSISVRNQNDIDTKSTRNRNEIGAKSERKRNEIDGDNDNENVSKENESPNGDSQEKAVRHKYGEFAHVMLTDEEVRKLVKEYGKEQAEAAITYLDEHIERKGYKAKSHYLAIRKWVFDALREEDIKQRELARREERLNSKPPEKPPDPKRGQERPDDFSASIMGNAIANINSRLGG